MLQDAMADDKSSPSRGTWIEIVLSPNLPDDGHVVPLTGDVD